MIKKILSVFMAITMMFSLVACGTTPAAEQSPSEVQASEVPAEDLAVQDQAEQASDGVWLPYNDDGSNKLDDRDATGSNGAVSSTSWYASKAGLEVLENGGNAVDAAYAVAYALGVVEPYTSGIGGGGFMTIYDAATRNVSVIDFREMAPSAASPDMWGELDENGKAGFFTLADGTQFTGNYSRITSLGGLSVAVPGEVAGLEYALENYGSGTKTRLELMSSAIDYAKNGWIVTPTMYNSTNDEYPEVSGMEELAYYYLDDGFPLEVGSTVTNEDLAKTLELIAENGASVFYEGEIADAIINAVSKYSGIMTKDDLKNYSIELREPVSSSYRDYAIYSLPPASSGGTHLIEILNILENFDMTSYEVNDSDYVHLFSEATKIAFADKDAYMADTAFYDVPTATLTSKDYAAARASEITDESSDYSCGDINEHGSTTSFSVLDKDGNMVACTITIGNFYGSKVAVEGYGFILNDEMYDFDTSPESVNCADGGKRPLSSMAPSIVLYPDGTPFMTIGTPGGTRIFSVLAQVIQRVIDYDMDIQSAVDSVRSFCPEGSTVYYEEDGVDALSEDTLKNLQGRGYELSVKNAYDNYFGGVQGIAVMKDGSIRAAADPRRSGKALAY